MVLREKNFASKWSVWAWVVRIFFFWKLELSIFIFFNTNWDNIGISSSTCGDFKLEDLVPTSSPLFSTLLLRSSLLSRQTKSFRRFWFILLNYCFYPYNIFSNIEFFSVLRGIKQTYVGLYLLRPWIVKQRRPESSRTAVLHWASTMGRLLPLLRTRISF